MNVYEIILKKRSGQALSKEEIQFFVNGYTKGTIPDYQFSAFLMAVYFQGMSFNETTALTDAMMHSGKVFNLSSIPGIKIDKHSTGGVGDKVSLILAPLVAVCGACPAPFDKKSIEKISNFECDITQPDKRCGVVVPMVSGRGLGHTGGTLDKLESIPGFRTDLTENEFKTQLKKIGVAMMGQTKELAPADKKIYALRDVTATVDSIPLIAASIMSKKLAEGIDGLVLDVKTGSGAFMRELNDAKKLAKVMIEIGKRIGKKVIALITNMEQPLGNMVGNALEVIESIECLKGKGPTDLMQVTMALAEEMLTMKVKSQEVRKMIEEAIESGAALEKFRAIIKAQDGDERVINNYKLLPQPKYKRQVKSPKTGYIHKIDALLIGLLSVELGCGKRTIDDKIDDSAGFIFKKKIFN
jgi:pyrimidine-nucleoside phosphorylase